MKYINSPIVSVHIRLIHLLVLGKLLFNAATVRTTLKLRDSSRLVSTTLSLSRNEEGPGAQPVQRFRNKIYLFCACVAWHVSSRWIIKQNKETQGNEICIFTDVKIKIAAQKQERYTGTGKHTGQKERERGINLVIRQRDEQRPLTNKELRAEWINYLKA